MLHRSISDDNRDGGVGQETSDDILAKYRKPQASKNEESNVVKPDDETDGVTVELDLANLEASVIFEDAKRKLRLMLSEVLITVIRKLILLC